MIQRALARSVNFRGELSERLKLEHTGNQARERATRDWL